jgi:hypothetical protein
VPWLDVPTGKIAPFFRISEASQRGDLVRAG